MGTQESNPFENLPQDLITEILWRLPVKSVLRFRCVSKSWLFLISSPEFETNYLEVSTTRRRRLVFGTATALYTCPLNGIFHDLPHVDHELCDFTKHYQHDYKIQMVGSCNGLVCLVYPFTGHIFVWNPAIRKYRQLRFPGFSSREPYGFGYDASSDDYKVVHIVHELNSTPYSRTYSLRNDSWKSSDWSHGRTSFGGSGVFLNGAIHWIVANYDDNGAKVWAVVAQSLATGELIWTVALPLQSWAFLQVLGERLCACFQCGFQIEVWVMKEYGVEKCWSKMFRWDESMFMRKPLLVTEEGVITTKTRNRFMSFIFLKNWDQLQYLEGRYVTATTYVESFVNPTKTW